MRFMKILLFLTSVGIAAFLGNFPGSGGGP